MFNVQKYVQFFKTKHYKTTVLTLFLGIVLHVPAFAVSDYLAPLSDVEQPFVVPLDENALSDRFLLGNKFESLVWFHKHIKQLRSETGLDLRVPNGFALTTAFIEHLELANFLTAPLRIMLQTSITQLEEKEKKVFGGLDTPLLISVRSSPTYSMPGVLDTFDFVGLTRESLNGFVKQTNFNYAHARYALHLFQFGTEIYNKDKSLFLDSLNLTERALFLQKDVSWITSLPASTLEKIVSSFESIFSDNDNLSFQNPHSQLEDAVAAIHQRFLGIPRDNFVPSGVDPKDLQLAIGVNPMILGDLNDQSGTAVIFTQDPNEDGGHWLGAYSPKTQGPQLVGGLKNESDIQSIHSDETEGITGKLSAAARSLISAFSTPKEIEVTIEDGAIYFFQKRNSDMSPEAYLRYFIENNLINTRDFAFHYIRAKRIRQRIKLIKKTTSPSYSPKDQEIINGSPNSTGIVQGYLADSVEKTKELLSKGKSVIFIARKPSQELSLLMSNPSFPIQGIIFLYGNRVSHESVLSRFLGIPSIFLSKSQFGDSGNLDSQNLYTLDGFNGTLNGNYQPSLASSMDRELGIFPKNEFSDEYSDLEWIESIEKGVSSFIRDEVTLILQERTKMEERAPRLLDQIEGRIIEKRKLADSLIKDGEMRQAVMQVLEAYFLENYKSPRKIDDLFNKYLHGKIGLEAFELVPRETPDREAPVPQQVSPREWEPRAFIGSSSIVGILSYDPANQAFSSNSNPNQFNQAGKIFLKFYTDYAHVNIKTDSAPLARVSRSFEEGATMETMTRFLLNLTQYITDELHLNDEDFQMLVLKERSSDPYAHDYSTHTYYLRYSFGLWTRSETVYDLIKALLLRPGMENLSQLGIPSSHLRAA